MDELNEARTELCRLQGTERTLLKRLLEIRAVIKTLKNKIDELIKKGPPAINRLPVEILSRIMFQSCSAYNVSTDIRGLQNRRAYLSTVSRLWRNIILDTPKLWSDIVVCNNPLSQVPSLEIQLARSGNVPLNVFIISWPHAYWSPGSQWLDV